MLLSDVPALTGIILRRSRDTIHGTTDPRFRSVRDAFAANFRAHGEVGAALCVYRRGRRVVDLATAITGSVK